MSTVSTLKTLRVALISGGLVVVVGCASGGRYGELQSEFRGGQSSAYYEHETARSAPASPAPEHADTDAYVDDVEATIAAAKARWQKELSTSTAGRPEALPPAYAAYRQLATSPDLDARLAGDVELDLLLALVYELNPSVKAARRNQRATLEQYPQAAYLDNILKQYNAYTKQLDTTVGPQNQKQMVAMQSPFPDTLALKGQLVNEEVEIAARQTEIALRDALAAMQNAYHNYQFIHASIAVNRENQRLLEQMIESVQAKIRTGGAKYNAVVMAQVELVKLEDMIITLDEQRQTIAAQINTLLGRSPDAALGGPVAAADQAIAPALDELYALTVERRQELQQMRLRIARMETMVELATRMATSDPSTGASTYEDSARLSGGTGDSPPAFMTQRDLNHAQTPWFGQRNAYIQETRVRLDAMALTLTAMEDQTRLLVKTAYFSRDRALRSISLYQRSLLPQARQSLNATATSYTAGEATLITYLDAQRTLLTFQLEEARAWRDLRLAQTELDRLAGGQLPRHPITLPGPTDADASSERP